VFRIGFTLHLTVGYAPEEYSACDLFLHLFPPPRAVRKGILILSLSVSLIIVVLSFSVSLIEAAFKKDSRADRSKFEPTTNGQSSEKKWNCMHS
jgi:hypothetical protein